MFCIGAYYGINAVASYFHTACREKGCVRLPTKSPTPQVWGWGFNKFQLRFVSSNVNYFTFWTPS